MRLIPVLIGIALLLGTSSQALADLSNPASIYKVEEQKPINSTLKVREGQKAPDFELPTTNHTTLRLSDYRGKKNVVLSFVPAAWTPICSDQWPGYNLVQDLFTNFNAQLIGITVDNIPTLHAWTQAMGGVWFPVASDFWPHGGVADTYGILRPSGTTERALFVIDTKGIIRWAHVSDINARPDLGELMKALEGLQ